MFKKICVIMSNIPNIRHEKQLLAPYPDAVTSMAMSGWGEANKNRRHSTIHSYTLQNYHTLPQDTKTLRTVQEMTSPKAMKNVIVLSVAFMFIFTAFVSLQSLQSTLHPGGVGVASLSCIYGTTVLSCVLAPWLINKLSTKWTMVFSFVLFSGYFTANFYPTHWVMLPCAISLGLLAGPLWSAQATYLTTLALTYSQHKNIQEPDGVINKYMGIFCGFYRSSQIWGNLISTLVLSNNTTHSRMMLHADRDQNVTQCGAQDCPSLWSEVTDRPTEGAFNNGYITYDVIIPDSTRYLLLSIYIGCGLMGIVILVALLDRGNVSDKDVDPSSSLTSCELALSTLKMFRDSKCLLLIPLVFFVGLEQGFMFGDFTKVRQLKHLYKNNCPVPVADPVAD